MNAFNNSTRLPNASPPVPGLFLAMLANTLLWSAGNGLTTGGFLNYFSKDVGADTTWLAIIFVTPDILSVCSLVARPALATFQARKFLWVSLTLASRFALLGIPCLALLRIFRGPGSDSGGDLYLLCLCIAVASLLQTIAGTLYHAWLADLVVPQRWARFFAWRAVATLLIQLATTIPFAQLRDVWAKSLQPADLMWAYVIIFVLGNLLAMASVFPFLFIASGPARAIENVVPSLSSLVEPFVDANRRWLLAHSYVLAAANGFTQAILFSILRQLNFPLAHYQWMLMLMLALQIPCAVLAACLSRTWGMKRLLFLGTIVAGLGMPCWIAGVVYSPNWIWGAYIAWGAFGAVNLVGPNLMLALSTRYDSETPIALFRMSPGILAGISGLAGAWLYDSWGRLPAWIILAGLPKVTAFYPAIACLTISFTGRILAAFLVLPVQEPTLSKE